MKIRVNGIELFYEKTGSGNPLILLHGNGETHEIFRESAEALSETYTVYAIDSRCHGQSEQKARLTYDDMADDVAFFIQKLDLQKPALCGFSDGAIVGILISVKYPNLLSKLVACGANVTPDGVKSSVSLAFRVQYLLKRDPKLRLMLREPMITPEQLSKIRIPVLLLAGSNDVIKESHTRYIAEHIRTSTLKLLSGENHGSYVIHTDKLAGLIEPFLSGEIT